MPRRLSLLAAAWLLAAWASAPAAAGPERAGAWTITSHTRVVDPTNALATMPRTLAGSVRHRIAPQMTTAYCVVGDADMVDVDAMQVVPEAECKTNRKTKSGDTYYLFYTCGEKGRTVEGEVIMSFDGDQHYTGRTSWSALKMQYVKWESIFEGRWTGDTCPAK